MAIAKLCRVVLASPKSDSGVMIAKLCKYSFFHPSNRDGLVEDPNLLLLLSRIHLIYSEANELLATQHIESEEIHQIFHAKDLFSLADALNSEMTDLKIELQVKKLSLTRINKIQRRLFALRDAAHIFFNNVRRIRVFQGFRRIIVVEGFVPSDKLQLFQQQLHGYIALNESVEKRLAREPYIPTLIVNPKIISLFENISLVQGLPRYNEIDPTPIVAFVFPLFFGVMLADIGRGLVLISVGLFVAFKMRKYGVWGWMLAILGSSSFVMGLFTGEVFGLRISTPFQIIVPLQNALENPTSTESLLFIFEIATVIGTFHLATAYAIAIINQIRSRNRIEAFLGHLPTLLLYSSSVPFLLAVIGVQFRFQEIFSSQTSTPLLNSLLGIQIPISLVAQTSVPIFVTSYMAMMFGRSLAYLIIREDRHIVTEALESGLVEGILKPIEFLANTISYIRLGALLLLSIILGSLTGRILELGLVGIPIFILANVGLIAIEGLIVYVQDLRIHLYEWFSKFYFGFGVTFSPLNSKGEFSEIKWQLH